RQRENPAEADPHADQLREALEKLKTLNDRNYERVQRGQLKHPTATKERLRVAMEGDSDGQRIPLTYEDRAQFDRFRAELANVFESEGITDATVVQIGSATQGWKGNPQKYIDYISKGGTDEGWAEQGAWKPSSDTDFAVFSEQALVAAMRVDA